jgi:GxxExxY protein
MRHTVGTKSKLMFVETTENIIRAAFEVHNTLGCGFLEKVYENSMIQEFERKGMKVNSQKPFAVIYKEQEVGFYISDLVVEDKVIIEIKAVDFINQVHKAQLINYLKISGLKVGLILNFAKPRLQIERMVL